MQSSFGIPLVQRAMETLAPQDQRALAEVMPISWVEVAPVMACKNAIALEVGMHENDFQRAVVQAGVRRTVRGVWKLLVRQLWDDALAKRLPILYSRTFDQGALRVEHLGDGTATLRLIGWPDMHPYDALGLATGLQTVLELAGRKKVRVEFETVLPSTETVFRSSWRR